MPSRLTLLRSAVAIFLAFAVSPNGISELRILIGFELLSQEAAVDMPEIFYRLTDDNFIVGPERPRSGLCE